MKGSVSGGSSCAGFGRKAAIEAAGKAVLNIDRFHRDHADLLSSIGNLRELVQGGVQTQAEAIVRLLITMSAAIKLHLAAEDRMLYPALARAEQSEAAQVGRQFRQEMGGLAAAYAAFVSRWNAPAKLAADPQGFRDEANAVFKALHQRIQREGRELYPLAERPGA